MSWRKPVTFVWLGVALLAAVALVRFWPSTPLHAVATDRSETFALATGYCDDGGNIEAVWMLDCLTGDLCAMVVSRQSGKFNAVYTRNILMDLGVDLNKNPKFQVVTGVAGVVHTGGANVAPSRCFLYVAEITTGKLAAFYIPWSSPNWARGMPLGGQIMRADVQRFRNAAGPGGKAKAAPADE
jgi:hypothetical protein